MAGEGFRVEAPFLLRAKIDGKSEEKKCEAKAEKNFRRHYRSVELEAKEKGVVPGEGFLRGTKLTREWNRESPRSGMQKMNAVRTWGAAVPRPYEELED